MSFMQLKSGRKVYANCEIFGLAETDEGFAVTEGYDGGVRWPNEGPPNPEDLTADDMHEIADLMIERWTRFKAGLPVKIRKCTR